MTDVLRLEFDRVARNLPDALCLVAMEGFVLAVNPVARRLYRFAKGDSLLDFFPEQHEKLSAFLVQSARSADAVPGGFELAGADGTSTACILHGNRLEHPVASTPFSIMLRIQSKQEYIRGFTLLNQKIRELQSEIAERKRAQQQLRRQQEQLEQLVSERTRELRAANRELEAFCYSVSHDLRGPLRAIDGFSRVLVEDHGEKLDLEAHEVLDRVRAAAQRMGSLIDDLLQLSRITRAELKVEEVDLSALAREILSDLVQGQPERRVETKVAENLRAKGDPRLLTIALENLLNNAWKYTSRSTAARIEFGAERQGRGIAYVVRDNGAGFDMAYADKLFKPFERLHHHDEFPGTGVGLAIVQRVIARHAGTVWAEGEVGNGASVYFTLPTRPRRS